MAGKGQCISPEQEQILSFPDEDDSALKRRLQDDYSEIYSEKMKIFLRVRPLKNLQAQESCLQLLDEETVLMDSGKSTKTKEKFTFSSVFGPDTSQETIFISAVQPLVDDFLSGLNIMLFAYGTTSSGKTFTMQGSCEEPGVIPRTLNKVFNCLKNNIIDGIPCKPAYFSDIVSVAPSEEKKLLQLKKDLLKQKPVNLMDFSSFGLQRSNSNFSISSESELSSFHPFQHGCLVWISFYEIYNEQVFDLLTPVKKGRRITLSINQDKAGNTFVRGLKEVPVSSPDEAYRLLSLARANLQMAETKLNHSSSRSHCIFNIRLVSFEDAFGQRYKISQLTFCDLAGSERPNKTGNVGTRLREAGNINTSLLVLSRCIETLRYNQQHKEQKLVPFRDSKLTRIMQTYFSTSGITAMIANVNPCITMAEETLNALKFTAVACEIIPVTSGMESKLFEDVTRLTEIWSRSSRQWSSLNAEAIGTASLEAVEEEDAEEEEFTDQHVEELLQIVDQLQADLDSKNQELQSLESTVRREVSDFFMETINSLVQSYDEQIENMKESFEIRLEKNAALVEKKVRYRIKYMESDSESEGSEEGGDEDNEERADLQKELEESRKRIEVLEKELKEKDETLLQLKDKSNEMTNVIQNQEIRKLRDDLQQYISKNNEQEELLHNLGLTIQEREEHISSLNVELQNLANESSLKRLQQKLEEVESLLKNESDRAEALSQELLHKQNTIETLSSDIEHLMTNQQANIKGDEFDLKQKLSDLKEENKKLLSSLDWEKENSAALLDLLKCDIIRKDEEIMKLNSQLEQRAHATEEIENELECQQAAVKEMLEEINHLKNFEDKKNELDEVIKNLHEELSKKEIASGELTKVIENQETSLEKYLKEVTRLKKVLAENESYAAEVDSHVQSLKEKLNSLEEEKGILITAFDENSLELLKLKHECDALDEQLTIMKTNWDLQGNKSIDILKEINVLLCDKTESLRMASEKSDFSEQSKQEIADLKKENEDLKELLLEQKSNCNKLENRVESLKCLVKMDEQREQENADLRMENGKLRQRLMEKSGCYNELKDKVEELEKLLSVNESEKKQTTELQDENKDLKEKLQIQNDHCMKLENKIQHLEELLTQIEESNGEKWTTLQNENKNLNQQLQDEKNICSQLRERVEDFKKKTVIEKGLESTNKDEELKQKFLEQSEHCNRLSEKIKDLESLLADREDQIKTNQENSKDKKEHESMEKQKDFCDMHENKIHNLQKILAEKEKLVKDLETTVRELVEQSEEGHVTTRSQRHQKNLRKEYEILRLENKRLISLLRSREEEYQVELEQIAESKKLMQQELNKWMNQPKPETSSQDSSEESADEDDSGSDIEYLPAERKISKGKAKRSEHKSVSDDDDFRPSMTKLGSKGACQKIPRQLLKENNSENTSPLKKFGDFIGARSPALGSVVNFVATTISGVSSEESKENDSMLSQNTGGRRKLYQQDNKLLACSPVPDVRKPVSPHKVVKRQLKNKKASKP